MLLVVEDIERARDPEIGLESAEPRGGADEHLDRSQLQPRQHVAGKAKLSRRIDFHLDRTIGELGNTVGDPL